MRTWTRATLERRCGRCGVMIRVGDPVLVLVLLGIHRPKVRCQALACAGEPVPAALPEAVVERASVTVMTRLGLLPLTFGREREVGEEG